MLVNLRLQQEDEEDALISFDMPDPAPYAAIIAEHGLTEASIEVPAYTIRPLFPLGTEHVEGWVSDEAREWVGFWLADNDEPEPEPVNNPFGWGFFENTTLALLHFHKSGLVHVELRCDGEWWSEPFTTKDFIK